MVKVREDLTGKIFGRLTVLRQADDYISHTGGHYACWMCQCCCQKQTIITVRGSDLKNNKTQSCGCWNVEHTILQNKVLKKKYNQYDLSGKYGIGYCSNTNTPFYFDLEDYELIKDYCWYEDINKRGYHSVRARDINTGKDIKLHWLIVGKMFDHIDLNPLNNRRDNLRAATYRENAQNGPLRKNNTSGVTGVSWSKDKNKWCVYIQINGKKTYLGSFVNKTEAIVTRLRAEQKYYGQFASQKYLFEQYRIEVDDNAE